MAAKQHRNGTRGRFAITPGTQTANPGTVELTGIQVHRGGDLILDQVYDVEHDFSCAVECEGRGIDELPGAIARLTELHERLETLGYNGVTPPDRVDVPLVWLFPQLEPVR